MATASSRRAAERIRALAARAEPSVRKQVEAALKALQHVPIDRIERALNLRDAFALHDLASSLPLRLRPAIASLERVFRDAATTAGLTLYEQHRIRIAARFDGTNPHALAAARNNAATLVREVTSETQAAIRKVVARGFAEGIPPREMAQLIRPMIGLTQRQANAVVNVRLDAVAEGYSRAAATSRARSYADKLLARRALTIARTETIRASTDGELEAWRQATREGLLNRGSLKEWITTPDDRLCPYCRRMDGQKVALDHDFRGGRFGKIAGPPLHPNCRCTVGLVPPSTQRLLRRSA